MMRISPMTNRRIRIILLAFACLIAETGPTRAEVINVGGQSEFDSLRVAIESAVSAGAKEIDVELAPKTYIYKESALSLSNRRWAGVSLRIRGNGARLIAEGTTYNNGEEYRGMFQPARAYITADGRELSAWGELRQTDRLIEVEDEGEKLCRLHWDNAPDMSERECADTWVQITQWFNSYVYKVSSIEGGWIYFTADNLSYNDSRKSYSVNLDYGYGGMMPRFRLCNVKGEEPVMPAGTGSVSQDCGVNLQDGTVRLPACIQSVRECGATNFLTVASTTIDSLSISSITFLGNKEADDYLLFFNKVRARSINISGCTFRSLGSGAVSAQNTDNLTLARDSFLYCRRYGVLVSAGMHARIENNLFRSMGRGLKNSFCVRVAGTDFLIADNEFADFGYGGVAVGTWWATPKNFRVSGRVSGNVLYYNDEYYNNAPQYGLMDSGAIYLYTQMDSVSVCGNLIHHYTGARDNRGIFCDDGAKNFTLEGNLILYTPNSFSIDSRRVLSVERNPKSQVKEVNVNNSVNDNLVDGSIRFEARDSGADCVLGRNVFLSSDGSARQKNVLTDLSHQEPFINARLLSFQGGKASFAPAAMRALRSLSAWPLLKKYVKE